MRLYLVRHAIAEPRDAAEGLNDAQRALTPRGVQRMERQAAGLQVVADAVREIWTSPLVRARQTADLLAAALDPPPRIRVVRGLSPGTRFDTILSRLARQADLTGVALVGHEPWMGELATYLLTGVSGSAIQFKKGGAACIEIEDFVGPIRGRLLWLLTPRQLRAIAKN